jgi:hypothetical protein
MKNLFLLFLIIAIPPTVAGFNLYHLYNFSNCKYNPTQASCTSSSAPKQTF